MIGRKGSVRGRWYTFHAFLPLDATPAGLSPANAIRSLRLVFLFISASFQLYSATPFTHRDEPLRLPLDCTQCTVFFCTRISSFTLLFALSLSFSQCLPRCRSTLHHRYGESRYFSNNNDKDTQKEVGKE